MSNEPNWEPQIRYPRLTDTLVDEGGGKPAKTLFTDLMAGRWSIYADGYRRAADALVDRVEGEAPDDAFLLPIVFLYRHFVELTLKDLLLRLVSLCDIVIDPKQITTHKLMPLWKLVRAHLNCIRPEMHDEEIVPALDKLITELSGLDPDSMHFRYAADREFANMVLPRSLSMEHLRSTMEKIYNGFAYIEEGIDMEWDNRAFTMSSEMKSKAITNADNNQESS
ncbi:MAG TPA: hypothetical protein VMZ30_16085 [Pyrinomonadaceae bacterium]|nr:hypothetical protein [Pyrinomonadaceae bacterium]